MIADYFFVRKQKLVVEDLFRHGGRYDGTAGWNLKGVTALVVGVAPNIPGFLHSVALVPSVPPIFDTIFTGAWFVGFFLSAIVYVLLNLGKQE
jgi:NCS1 family nucleobase:cation symporter-1